MSGMSVRRLLDLPTWAQDVLLAAFVTFFQIQGTYQASQNAEPELIDRTLSDPGLLGYALLTASGLALVVRRRRPVTVFVFVGAISMVYYGLDYPEGPAWMALFLALYTVTAYGDGKRSVRLVTGGIAVLAVFWVLSNDLQPETTGWLAFRIGASAMAAALGESVRSRRVIAAEAEERIRRAEQTREDEARRRVDAERLRIAREVHDTVAHAIAIINVQAGVTAHVLDKRPERARDTLETIEHTSAQALREMRAILGVLRGVEPAADRDADGQPLDSTQVDELVAVAREAGLDVRLDRVSPPDREVPGTVAAAAYRIVQESITNVIRHSGATQATVSLDYGPDHLEVRVTDDGRGCAVDFDGGTGRGIAGMRERCALLGGDLSAGSRPEGGFEVRAKLPWSPVGASA
jgi:signal transduction histidine kinase